MVHVLFLLYHCYPPAPPEFCLEVVFSLTFGSSWPIYTPRGKKFITEPVSRCYVMRQSGFWINEFTSKLLSLADRSRFRTSVRDSICPRLRCRGCGESFAPAVRPLCDLSDAGAKGTVRDQKCSGSLSSSGDGEGPRCRSSAAEPPAPLPGSGGAAGEAAGAGRSGASCGGACSPPSGEKRAPPGAGLRRLHLLYWDRDTAALSLSTRCSCYPLLLVEQRLGTVCYVAKECSVVQNQMCAGKRF